MTQVNVDPNIIDQLTNRQVMAKDHFIALPHELRTRAFTIAHLTDANVLQQTLDALRETVAGGGTLWNFRENFPDIAKSYTEAGRDWHLTLIYQNNVRQARATGAYQARQQVKAAFPYVEYRTGPNPRPSHAALNGKIFHQDDPFLLAHTPPWEHGCNCDLVPRTAAQVGRVQESEAELPEEERSVAVGNSKLQSLMSQNKLPDPSAPYRPISVLPPSQRADGDSYSFRPDRLNQPLNLSDFDPEIRKVLIPQLEQLGYRLDADGVTAIPGPPPSRPQTPPSPSASRAIARLGRPLPPKWAVSALSGGRVGRAAAIRPDGRVSIPAPQIARVGRPLSSKEAA